MKKIIASLIVVIMLGAAVFILSGCSYGLHKTDYTEKAVTTPIDSEFATSGDNKKVVFIRDTGDHRSSKDFAEGTDVYNQIVLLDRDSQKEDVIVQSGNLTNFKIYNLPDDYPTDRIYGIENLLLSKNGDKAYFATMAWLTSMAVFSVDLKTKELTYITDGKPIEITTQKNYQEDLIVNRRKRIEDKNGGYEEYCNFVVNSSNGKIIKDLNSCPSK